MLFIDKNHSLLHCLNAYLKSSIKTQEQYSLALFSYLYFSVKYWRCGGVTYAETATGGVL